MTALTLPVGGYAPRDTAHGSGLEAFQAAVVEGTDGAVEVPVTWNILDQGRPVTDLFEMVESGELFMCYFSTSYQGGRVPAFNIIEVPFIFDELRSAHRALDGDLGSYLTNAVRASTGFEMLGYWDNGFRHFTNLFMPMDEYKQEMDRQLREFRASESMTGEPVRLPGERATELESEQRRSGIPVPSSLVSDLNTLAEKLGAGARLT